MVTHPDTKQKGVLEKIARRAIQAYGFLPNFSTDALKELETVQQVDLLAETPGIDLRHLLWVSIDNGDSLDLDQLTVAQALTDKQVKVLVAIAAFLMAIEVDTPAEKAYLAELASGLGLTSEVTLHIEQMVVLQPV